MATYVYRAKRGPHEVVEGELEAPDENQAVHALDGLGLSPVAIQVKRDLSPVKAGRVAPLPAGLRKRHVIDFVRSLANLVKGNIQILKALSLMEKQSPPGMREIVADLVGAVRQGAPLSQAMERRAGVFPPLLIGMVRAGESAGLLGEMLEKTADHEEKVEDLRRKVRGALAYPLFVFAIGGLTIFILLVYFMPRLMESYLSNQQELPWPTKVTLTVSGCLSAYWPWILGAFALLFLVIRRRGGSSQGSWDRLILQIPVMNTLALKNAVIGFNRTLGLLVSHGVPLVNGVALAADTVMNRVLRERLAAVQGKLVQRGASLGAALREVPGYPTAATALVVVGEESGALPTALDQIATQYEREVESWLKTSTTLIEPAMILIVGGIVGFVVFAMLMPIFQMDVLMGGP